MILIGWHSAKKTQRKCTLLTEISLLIGYLTIGFGKNQTIRNLLDLYFCYVYHLTVIIRIFSFNLEMIRTTCVFEEARWAHAISRLFEKIDIVQIISKLNVKIRMIIYTNVIALHSVQIPLLKSSCE